MNYDSRSTWDSGLDAGSIPARSIEKADKIILSFLFFFTIL